MAEFTYEVKENYGVISTRRMNNIELRLISWNGADPKYDIRGWYDYKGEERCVKGVSFSDSEMLKFMEIINSIDLDEGKQKLFGEIQQNGRFSTKIQLTKYGYDIRVYNGNFGVKGVTLNKDDMQKLRDVINGIFHNQTEEVEQISETAPEEKSDPSEKWKEQSEDDKVIQSLTSLPVNDGNYPIKTATIYQLTKAIEQMENEPNGHHKTRLARCKAKLSQLESKETKKIVDKVSEDQKTEENKEVKRPVENENKEKPVNKANIIQFPKKDTEPVLKFEPSEQHHTYEEAEAKLKADRAKFDPNPDHDYVIEGVLEACVTDQELIDNVMRSEKSYIGAFQYLFEKARQGYCTKVGNNVGIMDKNDALKYTIDYFNTDEEKVKAKKEAEVKAREEARKKAAAEKKKASGKKSTKNTEKKGA